MFLILFVALAMGVFLIANLRPGVEPSTPTSRWLPCAFYAACGLAFMTKSLIGLAFIGSGCGLFAICQRERRIWRFLFDPLGLVLFVACLLAWPLAAYLAYPQFLADQVQHHAGRFQGVWGQDEPVYCYLYAIPRCALPWSPLALWGIVVGWRQGWARGPLGRFAVCWIVPGTILLTLSQWRHYHYVAPLIPPLAVLGAMGLADALERLRQRNPNHWWRLPLLATISLAVAAVVVARLPNLRGRDSIQVLIAALVAGCWLLAWLSRRQNARAQVAAVFAVVWFLAAGTFQFVIPHYDLYSQLAGFAERVNRLRPDDVPLHMVDLAEDQLTWYLQRPLVRVDDPAELNDGQRVGSEPIYLIAPQSALDEFAKEGRLDILERSPVAPRRIESMRVSYARWQRPLLVQPVSLKQSP